MTRRVALRVSITRGAWATTHARGRRAARVVLTGSAMWWTFVAVVNVVVLAATLH